MTFGTRQVRKPYSHLVDFLTACAKFEYLSQMIATIDYGTLVIFWNQIMHIR